MASWGGFFKGLGKLIAKIATNDQAITVILTIAEAKAQADAKKRERQLERHRVV